MKETLIIAPPPTPNGDLHVGHMAGPYLAGDIYARYLRLHNRNVNYSTGTDDNQTYVITSSYKLGISKDDLRKQSSIDIHQTLISWGISLDGYAPFDDTYRNYVYSFLNDLFNKNLLEYKTVKLPYSELQKEFMVEAFVTGDCPTCLSKTKGGVCETCGHPNNFDNLLNPTSTLNPNDKLIYKSVNILVFPVEKFRDQLKDFYNEKHKTWRPKIMKLVNQILSKELLDFPITYPIKWGFPSNLPGTKGQVINAWFEGMPASMYCSNCSDNDKSYNNSLWDKKFDSNLVYFLGFDNSYFWGIVHLALLIAHGKYVLPKYIIPNEFYELEYEKFSTSKNHLIWARDLIKDIPRDYARFYLCATSPEHNRNNFSKNTLIHILNNKIVTPWNHLVSLYNEKNFNKDMKNGTTTHIKIMDNTLRDACELNSFSQIKLSDWCIQHISRLLNTLKEEEIEIKNFNTQLQLLINGMGLIMIDFLTNFNAINNKKADINEKFNLSMLPTIK